MVDGRGSYEGILEIFHDNRWGTVCDDVFDQSDAAARVVCSELGYSGGVYYSKGVSRDDNVPIWLDSVGCVGIESHIVECDHLPWGEHNCYHGEDVAVRCDPVIVLRGK